MCALQSMFFLDQQGSHRLEPQREEDSRKWEGSADRKPDVCPTRTSHALPSTENVRVQLEELHELMMA